MRQAPCAKCPMRAKYLTDDYLAQGRRQDIINSVRGGGEFACHETVDHDARDLRTEEACVGVDLVLLRADEMPQMLRIRERLGMVQPQALLDRNADTQLWTIDDISDDAEGIDLTDDFDYDDED